MLSSINEDDFCNAFMQWMRELLRTKGTHIIIDGKALRAATERIKDGHTPREDRFPARKSKNNLAMLRKFVFNILQIAWTREKSSQGFSEMMDSFADDSNFIFL